MTSVKLKNILWYCIFSFVVQTNDWNPKVEMKVEIYTDGGAMISCINKEISLDIES